jgi:GYF domain 2
MGRRGSGMSESSQMAEWFLARDGQQFGPVSDMEFRKLVELGHLKPTDLVWREGLPEWTAAAEILGQFAPQSNPAPPPEPSPAHTPYQPATTAPTYSAPPLARGHDAHGQVPRPAEQRPRPRTIAPEPTLDIRGAGTREPDYPQDTASGLQVEDRANPQTPRKKRRAPRDGADANGPSRSRLATVGRWIKRAAVLLFFGSTLSAAAWYAYPHRGDIMRIASAVTGSVGGGQSIALLSGISSDAGASDLALQKVPLWRVLKRDYPDWYSARVKEASELSRTGKPEAAVALHVADALAKLRRQYAGDALSATPVQLQAVATSFAQSLTQLRKHSIDACYTYISSGESNPTIVPLLQTPELGGQLQRQLLAVFNAVAEGRKTPRVYPPPKQSDYDILVKELEARGWTQADMQLFSDSRALAKATPEKVCLMVTQWFESQIAIKDPDTQLRLLVDSLRPVVAG